MSGKTFGRRFVLRLYGFQLDLDNTSERTMLSPFAHLFVMILHVQQVLVNNVSTGRPVPGSSRRS